MIDNRLTPNKFLNDIEFQTLESNLSRWAAKEPRNALIFRLLLCTGARPSELLNIRFDDVIFEEKAIFIKGLKGSYSRTIPIPDQIWSDLIKYLKRTEPQGSEVIFSISYPTLWAIWRDWRPCKKALRATRHTFAIRLYKKTKDIRLVQMALGHKSSHNTDIYLVFDYGITQMRAAICE
jgi:integrase